MGSSIKSLIQFGADSLKRAGIENYYSDARIIFQYCSEYPIEKIISDSDDSIDDRVVQNFWVGIEKRAVGMPISKIFHHREFYGLEFYVTEDTLDPRPETELIIDNVLSFYNTEEEIKILDLGTGTGCLAISLLSVFYKSNAVAVDISEKALTVAKKNAIFHDMLARIFFVQSNWFDALNENYKFDCIVSNPPYIATRDLEFLDDNVKKYDPVLALDGGKSGVDHYRKIAAKLSHYLTDFGIAVFEFGKGQEDILIDLFKSSGYKIVEISADLAGIKRTMTISKR